MEKLRQPVKISMFARWTMRTGIPAAVIVGAGALAFASVPHSFSNGDTLQAADLNANFAALDQRITALEAKATTIQTVSQQAVATADSIDSGNYSVYVACPANSRLVGGGCSLFSSGSINYEYNSQGHPAGCPGALASFTGGTPTSRMCLRTGAENIGDSINDGNGSLLTIISLGWKCSMGAPPPLTSLKAYAICLQSQ